MVAGLPMVPHGPAFIPLSGVVFGPARQAYGAMGSRPAGLAAANQLRIPSEQGQAQRFAGRSESTRQGAFRLA